jgi:hypothetical protein
MRKSQREAARQSAEDRKHRQREQAQQTRDAQKNHASVIIQKLSTQPRKRVERVLGGTTLPSEKSFFEAVEAKAARLIIPEYKTPLQRLCEFAAVRPLPDWKVTGKGREGLFRGLCEHLLAEYPVRPFLWSAFFVQETSKPLLQAVVDVARGKSLFKLCQAGEFPIPLTRAQCHEFLQSPASLPFMKALRRVQVRAEKGDARLFENWMKLDVSQRIHDAKGEAFWLTVLRFFAQNPFLDPSQMRPLVDYSQFRYRQSDLFSMKGRTGASLLRDMNAWHGELNKAKTIQKHVYTPSGLPGITVEKVTPQRRGPRLVEIWTISEILTSQALLAEGKAMRHCVSSYSWKIAEGAVSIWSLTLRELGEESRMLTIEVQNKTNQIVQVRGPRNRMPTARESTVVSAWATKAGLGRSSHSW